jgi:hypothetical protein
MRKALSVATLVFGAGCSVKSLSPATLMLGPLSFKGTIEPSTAGLTGVIDVANQTQSEVTLGYSGMCAVALLVFSDSTLSGTPTWDQARWWNSRAGGCKWFPSQVIIGGGSHARISTPPVQPGIILGDSLPSGTYYAAVRLIVGRVEPASPIPYRMTVDRALWSQQVQYS